MSSLHTASSRRASTTPHATYFWCRWVVLGLLISLLTVWPGSLAQATSHTWFVAPTGRDAAACTTPTIPCKTIAATLSKAAAGDTIRLAAGTYPENLTITKSITLIGAGATTTLIDGQNRAPVITIPAPTPPATIADLAVALSEVTIQHGRGGNAAGINNSATLTMTDVVITQNQEGLLAGGLYTIGRAVVTRATITHNTGAEIGGVHAGGTLILTESTINQNTNGGLYNLSELQLQRVTVTANQGTGIINAYNLTVTNSVISNNIAQTNSPSGAGGIFNTSKGLVNLNNATVSSNTGIGIATSLFLFGTVTAHNSIVANNSPTNCVEINGQEPSQAFRSNGHNLENTATCNFTLSSDLQNSDPHLSSAIGAPLPLVGSPAIDAGDSLNCPAVDRLGTPRPIDGNGDQSAMCDIGAFEFLPNATYLPLVMHS